LKSERGVHVCGRISSNLFSILASIDEIQILNFEFHDTPENINVVDKTVLEKYDKVLAPGVASSKKPVVESTEEILSLLKRIYDKAGGRIDLISADCGFGGLRESAGSGVNAYSIGLAKLKNIVQAARALATT